MFGIGMPELILILIVALFVFGPNKLPELAKSLGKAIGEFKKATREFKDNMDLNEDVKDIKKAFNEAKENVMDTSEMRQLTNPVPDDQKININSVAHNNAGVEKSK